MKSTESGCSGHFILFHLSSLHVITPLSSAAFWWTNNNTNRVSHRPVVSHSLYTATIKNRHSLHAVLHFNKPQDIWTRGDQSWGLWLKCSATCLAKPKQRRNTSYQLPSLVVEGWWFRLVLRTQVLGTMQSLSRPWTPLRTKTLWSRMWGHLSNSKARLGHITR